MWSITVMFTTRYYDLINRSFPINIAIKIVLLILIIEW